MAIANITGNILTDSGVATSSLLPLTGGTLTGALNGTSATFSGDLTIDTNTLFVNSSTNMIGMGTTSPTDFGSGYTGLSIDNVGAGGGVLNLMQGGARKLTIAVDGGNVSFAARTSGESIIFRTNDGTIAPRLTIASTGAATFSSTAQNAFLINSTNTDGPILQIQNSGNNLGLIGNAEGITNGGVTNFAIRATNNLIFSTGGANPRMTITSGGNVGIGTSSPITNLHIRGNTSSVVYAVGASNAHRAEYQVEGAGQFTGSFVANPSASSSYGGIGTSLVGITTSSTAFVIATSEIERMRITSGGDIAMGATSASAGSRLSVVKSSSDYVLYVENTNNTSGDKTYRSILGSNTNNTNSFHFSGNAAGGDRIYIYGNGNIVNSNNSYGSLSDIKLKENITDASPKLDDLLKIKIKNFNFIGSQEKQIGVIAQELEEIFPSMIDETEDYEQIEIIDDKGNVTTERKSLGTTTKSVKYSVFVPMLIKAIQELEAKVSALENKS